MRFGVKIPSVRRVLRNVQAHEPIRIAGMKTSFVRLSLCAAVLLQLATPKVFASPDYSGVVDLSAHDKWATLTDCRHVDYTL